MMSIMLSFCNYNVWQFCMDVLLHKDGALPEKCYGDILVAGDASSLCGYSCLYL